MKAGGEGMELRPYCGNTLGRKLPGGTMKGSIREPDSLNGVKREAKAGKLRGEKSQNKQDFTT